MDRADSDSYRSRDWWLRFFNFDPHASPPTLHSSLFDPPQPPPPHPKLSTPDRPCPPPFPAALRAAVTNGATFFARSALARKEPKNFIFRGGIFQLSSATHKRSRCAAPARLRNSRSMVNGEMHEFVPGAATGRNGKRIGNAQSAKPAVTLFFVAQSSIASGDCISRAATIAATTAMRHRSARSIASS